jgi:hypothetical protein
VLGQIGMSSGSLLGQALASSYQNTTEGPFRFKIC